MQNTINSILKYSIIIGLSAITFIPLYIANPLFFPFISGKAFAFRIIMEIVFALWIILFIREKGTNAYKTNRSVFPKINSLTIFITIFTVIVLIADIMGVNPLRSIWSNSERMEGWIMLSHLWAYFIVLTGIMGSGDNIRKNWHRFFNVTIFAAFIVAIYGLFQYFGWADIHQGSSRIDATLGNSAYMAVYMLIHVFLALYMLINNINNKVKLYLYSILTLLFSFILFQTGTRGSILGWAIGIIISCSIYFIWDKSENKNSNKFRYLSAGIILILISIGTLFYFNRNSTFIKNSEVLNRLASISISDTKTQARGYVWPMALKGSFENIKTSIIGSGQENFNYIFNKNYNPKMWAHEQWFDRAHNVYLDWLVSTGLLGLLSYLSLYLLALIYIIKSDLKLSYKSVLIGLISAYGIHNVFVFDNQTSYIMFITVLAFIHSLKVNKISDNHKDIKVSEDYITVRDYIFVPIIVIVFISGMYFINIRNIQANTRLIDSLISCSGNGNIPSIKPFQNALSLNQTMLNQEIREQLITCTSNVVANDNISQKTKGEFYGLVLKEIENQKKDTPNDARIYAVSGSLFNSIGDWESGLISLQKARELSPGKQAIMFDMAVNYINTGKSKEAVEIAKKAYDISTDYPAAKSLYIITLVNNNQESLARELFPNDTELFRDQRVLNLYTKNKQYDKVIGIYKDILSKNPNDIKIRTYLASVYYLNGQNWLAIQELRTIADKAPELKREIDATIKDIESGKQIPLK